MNRIFMLLLGCGCYVQAFALQGYAGGWFLKKVVPVAQTDATPLLNIKDDIQLEIIRSQFTIWTLKGMKPTYQNIRTIPLCHPNFLGGGQFKLSEEQEIQHFADQAGGMAAVNNTLQNDLGLSLSNIGLVGGMGCNEDGKEPCKGIENASFYVSKDKKHVLMFKYPYIYRFDGGYGKIGR